MNVESLRELAAEWRTEAELYALRGLDDAAKMARSFAGDLEERLREWELETLDLRTAAEESGYSYDRLQRLVREGVIPNAGEPGSPRVRRGDLPRRPGTLGPGVPGPDLATEILEARLQ